MSRRQLRRLQKEKEIPEVEVDENNYESDHPPVKSRKSLFASLAGLEDDEDEGEDVNEGEENETSQALALPFIKPATDADIATKAPSRKKNKNKKKKKGKGKESIEIQKSVVSTGMGNTTAKQQVEEGDTSLDEIDRALREVNLRSANIMSEESSNYQGDSLIDTLLKINPYNLKVGNEMKTLFGKDTVAAAEAEEQQSNRATPRRQVQQMTLEDALKARPGQGLKEVSIKRNYLIQGKKTWPLATTGGLSMITNGNEYRFSHDKSYTKLEAEFMTRSSTYNPDLMIEFLMKNPYHISSLVVVSKIAKHQGDHACAADLRERALFSFGRIMIQAFKHRLENGTARLDFKRPENRQFWLAGQQYLISLMRRGTHKTALEWAKLLLILDPTDPYAIGQLLHVEAIKAKEFQWFVNLCETGIFQSHWGYPAQTAGLAKLRIGNDHNAIETIRNGMRQYPWLYAEMFKEFGRDIPKSIWGVTIPSDADDLYTRLYIKQTKDMWNFPIAMDALVEAAKGVEKCERNESCKAAEVTLGVARMVYLDGDQDIMAMVPRQMLHSEPNFEFDPLPPPREVNLFSNPIQEGIFSGAGSGAGSGADATSLASLDPAENGRGNRGSRGALNAILEFMRTQIGAFGGNEDSRELNSGEQTIVPEEISEAMMNMAGYFPESDNEDIEEYDMVEALNGNMDWLRSEGYDDETDVEMPELFPADENAENQRSSSSNPESDSTLPGMIPAEGNNTNEAWSSQQGNLEAVDGRTARLMHQATVEEVEDEDDELSRS